MNYKSLTQINYNDPLPKLGNKVIKEIPISEPVAKWAPIVGKPGLELNKQTRQLRTNFPENEEKVTTAKYNPIGKNGGYVVSNSTIQAGTIQAGTTTPFISPTVPTKSKSNLELLGELGWRSDAPEKPGTYTAFFYYDLYSLVPEKNAEYKMFTKYWDGTKWFLSQTEGPVGSSYGILWYDPTRDLSLFKDKLDPFEVPGSNGWRKDTPKAPGKYYATNIHIVKGQSALNKVGFKFIRTWDGDNWTKANIDVPMGKVAQRNILWHPRPISDTK